jgi:hypothetical protein
MKKEKYVHISFNGRLKKIHEVLKKILTRLKMVV